MSRVADPNAKSSLLRAAEEVFAERGLAGAKVEEIAKRAGLSKGAFYLHFDSKEAALKQIVETFLERCHAFFAPPSAYPSMPEDPVAILDFCLERDLMVYEFLWESRPFLRILPTCQGACDYLMHSFYESIAQTTREWVSFWRNEGLFRQDVDVELASVLICGAYNELCERMLKEEERPALERWLAFAQASFMRAFGGPELVASVEERNLKRSFGIAGRAGTSRRVSGRNLVSERGRNS